MGQKMLRSSWVQPTLLLPFFSGLPRSISASPALRGGCLRQGAERSTTAAATAWLDASGMVLRLATDKLPWDFVT